ncbi:MAG TPA: glycosyltransferase [Gemmatimonadales bacterium]|nr:glycosyltransferase [Gemmatimonadales bacterium]
MHILWIKTELLHPVDKGGRIRTYNMLRALRREHRVTYVALDDGSAAPDAVERASEYADDLVRIPFRTAAKGSSRFYGELLANVFSPLPYAVAKYRNAALRRAIGELVARENVDVVVCDFLAPSLNVPDDLPVPTVLFQHNVEAMIWRRHAEVARGAIARRYFREQWRRMERFERAECRRFDHVIAVSAEDRDVFRSAYGVAGATDVPTGVDVEFFRPSGTVTREPLDMVFTGSMDWLPNEDGILWFADEILPRIRARIPGATLTVVGRNPPARIRALAERDRLLRVTGTVPDVRPYIERAAVFVVPLRIGGGTRLKIFEAMAMERAVVSTAVGAEGLPVTDGTHVLLADAPDAFAGAVATLLEHPERADTLGSSAAHLVRSSFGWDRVADIFAEQCAGAAGTGVITPTGRS